MTADLVKLNWTDRTGRRPDGYVILPRDRAERLVHWILGEHDTRFDLWIDPWAKEVPMPGLLTIAFWLGLVSKGWSFVSSNVEWATALGVILALGALTLLSIFLPTSQLRVYPVVIGFTVSGVTGFLLSKV